MTGVRIFCEGSIRVLDQDGFEDEVITLHFVVGGGGESLAICGVGVADDVAASWGGDVLSYGFGSDLASDGSRDRGGVGSRIVSAGNGLTSSCSRVGCSDAFVMESVGVEGFVSVIPDILFDFTESFDRGAWPGGFTGLIIRPCGCEFGTNVSRPVCVVYFLGFDPTVQLVFPSGLDGTGKFPWIAESAAFLGSCASDLDTWSSGVLMECKRSQAFCKEFFLYTSSRWAK